MLNLLKQLTQQNVINPLNYFFAKMIADKQAPYNYPVEIQNLAILLAGLLSYAQQQGHSCIILQTQLMKSPFNLHYRAGIDNIESESDAIGANLIETNIIEIIKQKINYIEVEKWPQSLKNHITFSHDAQHIAPMLFQDNFLYFYRTWQEEMQIATFFKNTIQQSQLPINNEQFNLIRSLLDNLFVPQNSASQKEPIDWQKVAVAMAIRHPFCFISGGPGTGKTSTVAKIITALQILASNNEQLLTIKLVAPTGKAASRLTESINNAIENIAIENIPISNTAINYQALKQSITLKATTIHRLLGIGSDQGIAKYNSKHLLTLDLLIVDEVSMIDLSLMAKLINALPKICKLILLGDKDQLASVEVGAMIGELSSFLQQKYSMQQAKYLQQTCGYDVEYAETGNPIRDHLCHLNKSYRYQQSSGIHALAVAVNQGKWQESYRCFERYEDINFITYPQQPENDDKALPTSDANLVTQYAVQHYQDYFILANSSVDITDISASFLEKIFSSFHSIQFLAALRIGELGVEKLNDLICYGLTKIKSLNKYSWFTGKPIMITENDTNTGLFNGDIGLYLTDKNGLSRVWFEVGKNQFRSILPSRIPKYETAFVTTVHKSQGSEFEHVVFILPNNLPPILSKELVYTAVTRAKQKLSIFGTEYIWKMAIQNRIKRHSGFACLLNKDKDCSR